MNLTTGNKAPDFMLKDTEGNDVKLSDFNGTKNILLLFFPLAFTGVCTKEMCYMRDNLAPYNDMNVEVMGISVDSFFVLKEFKKARGLNFTLLSDFNRDVSEAYGALHDDFFGMKGVSKRAAFLIDTDGIIRYAEVLDNPSNLPDFDAALDVASRLAVTSVK
ncbi:MAG: peroxiredoxin [Cyclonatronaceae bacterium]